MTAQGVPDAEFIFPLSSRHIPGHADTVTLTPGAQAWIEFKTTSGWAVTLRPAQVGWLSRRVRHGGRAFVAVRRVVAVQSMRRTKADELYLIPLTSAEQPALLRDEGLRGSVKCFTWSGGPGVWNWSEVARILKGEE